MSHALLKKALHLLLAVVTTIVLASPVAAQQTGAKAAANPLVRLLQSKGILTDEEAALVSQAASLAESDQRLAKLLLAKGLITQEDYNQTVGASLVATASDGSAGARVVPAVLRVPVGDQGTQAQKPAAPAPPKVIPAVAPIRVFPVDPPKREGIAPDIKIGPVRLKPYGFFKASVVHDTSSPGGNDFPLPLFLGDTGPDGSPEFHIKARALRIGGNFEWVDLSTKLTLTGRLELDFEGNFTRTNNRNISSIRSNQPSLRLAWTRLDYAASDKTTIHAVFGQDWTPFASSTLPNLLETTGLGIAYGSLYERAPQARFGFTYNFGGSRTLKFQPEIAAVLPAFGNLPDISNQLAFGERQGVDSGRPEVQGRVVWQFQLDKARGVAPAQIIASFMQGERRAIVLASAIPAAFKGTGSPLVTGVRVGSDRVGYTGEVQLPTRWFTLIGKYYNGEDLRFYFGGQLFSTYNDTAGLFHLVGTTCVPGVDNVSSIDSSSTVALGFTTSNCAPASARAAPQRPVRSSGGFANLALPLSRIFNANPDGRNNGWTLALHYGIDYAKARDVRRATAGTAGNRVKSDLGAVTLSYKLNSWVTFAVEESYYRTRALQDPGRSFPLFAGSPQRSTHNIRSEFATVFTF